MTEPIPVGDPMDILPVGMDPKVKIAIAEFCEQATRNYGKEQKCKECGGEYYTPQTAWSADYPGIDYCRPCGLKLEKKRLHFSIDCFDADLEFDYNYTEKEIRELVSFGHFITGPLGVGKTHLNHAIMAQLLWQGHKSIKYVEFHPMTRCLRSAHRPPDYMSEERILARWSDVEILFIDEVFGSRGRDEDFTDEENHILFEIIRGRASHRKQTYITSNYGPAELEEKGCNVRTLDRLRSMCKTIILDGTQRKVRQGGGPQQYSHPKERDDDDRERSWPS